MAKGFNKIVLTGLVVGLLSGYSAFAQNITAIAVISEDKVVNTIPLQYLLIGPKMMVPSGSELNIKLPPISCKKDPKDNTDACSKTLKEQPPYGFMLQSQQMRNGEIQVKVTEMYCRAMQTVKNPLSEQDQKRFNMQAYMAQPLDCSQAEGFAKVVPGGEKVRVLNEQGKPPFAIDLHLMAVSVNQNKLK